MRYTPEFVDRFCLELGSAQPQKPPAANGMSKQRIVSSVRPQIDLWRQEGHSLAAIAMRFSELGVSMSAATLRTCLRRSKPAPRASRPKPKPRTARATNSATPPQNSIPTAPLTGVTASSHAEATEEYPPQCTPRERPQPSGDPALAQSESVLGVSSPTNTDTGSRKEEAAPTRDVPAHLPAPPVRDTEPAVAPPRARANGGNEKPSYRSSIIIRPEKPLSAFKENSQ